MEKDQDYDLTGIRFSQELHEGENTQSSIGENTQDIPWDDIHLSQWSSQDNVSFDFGKFNLIPITSIFQYNISQNV